MTLHFFSHKQVKPLVPILGTQYAIIYSYLNVLYLAGHITYMVS